jgi:hypothetical protein
MDASNPVSILISIGCDYFRGDCKMDASNPG